MCLNILNFNILIKLDNKVLIICIFNFLIILDNKVLIRAPLFIYLFIFL